MKLQSNKKRNTIIIISVILAVVVLAGVVGLILIFGDQSEKKNPQDIVGISLVSRPSQTTYYVGEEFDPAGTKIQVGTYDMAYTSFVEYDNLTFSGFDSSAPAEGQVITVSYKGFTTTFTVDIKEPLSNTPYLVSIEPKDLNTTYPKDEWNTYGPDYNGASLLLTYSDGTTESVWIQNSWATQREKMDAPGKTYVTIEYMGKTVQVEFTITN